MPCIDTLFLSTGALGSFTWSGITLSIYMGPTALRGIRATGDTLSNVESQVFTPYKFGSSWDQTPNLLNTRPTCYRSATALLNSMVLIPLWSCIPTRSHYCSISVLFIEAETVCFRFVCPSRQSFLCRHTHVLMFTCRQPMVTSTITSP